MSDGIGKPGTRIGAYRVEASLGRGGMGEVVLAFDERLERHVAIKQIRHDKPIDARQRARFRREARAIARLSHPAIVRIFDILDVDGGEYIVMEYVQGTALHRVLAERPGGLDIAQAVRLAVDLADGLAQAHAKGLIHRDLKPENVIVTPAGHAVILDFGLARVLSRDPGAPAQAGDADATESGMLVGTAHTMSPEQAAGEAIDHRSDLFALGSLLYQMVTGTAPFRGANLYDTLRRVITHDPPPVMALRDGVPDALAELLRKLLAKNAADRPASARAVLAELEHIARLAPTRSPGVADRPGAEGPARPLELSPEELGALATESAMALLHTPEPLEPAPARTDAAVPVLRVISVIALAGDPDRDGAGPDAPGAGDPARGALEAMARARLAGCHGIEVESTGARYTALFERPGDAVAFALHCHRDLGRDARAAVHLGEVTVRRAAPEHVARGARPLHVSGPALAACARLTALALPRQTLITRAAFDLARHASASGSFNDPTIDWLAHGRYAVRDVDGAVEVCEIGRRGFAPLRPPPDSDRSKRIVAPGDELTLGWRPAVGQSVPQRSNWTLRERIGQGGFGEVWLADHPGGETRVFKFCFDPDRLRALEREITLFRLLERALGQRPDIARILDWNLSAAPYFVESEYTEGGDLVDWSDERGGLGELPLAVRLELVAQIADALAATHSVGVLHKDVKPANILVASDRDGRACARLADFGIGLVLDRDSLAEHGVTAMGFSRTLGELAAPRGGTPAYMAPEVLQGKPATIQADLYSLGVVLYQVVAGDLERPLAPGWERDLAGLPSTGTDAFLIEDITRMVDRDPARRPGSAAEVAERLRTLEARRAARASEEQARARAEAEASAARQALDRAHRRRQLAAWVAASTTLMLVVASVFAYQAWKARGRERASREQAEHRREQAERLIDFMLGDLRAKLEPVGKLAILREVGDQALAYFASVPEGELSDDELVSRAKALHQIGEVRLAMNELAGATAAFRESLRVAESLAARDPHDASRRFQLGQSQYWVGYLLWQQQQLEPAREAFRAYLRVSQELIARDPQNRTWMLELAYAHSNLGTVAAEQGDLAAADASLRAGAGIMETLLAQAPDDDKLRLELAELQAKLGDTLRAQGDLAGAAKWFDKHLEATEGLSRDDPDDRLSMGELAAIQNKTARVLLARTAPGDVDSAGVLLEAERVICGRLLAQEPDRPEWRLRSAFNHRSFALLASARSQPAQAIAYAEQAVALLEALAASPSLRVEIELAAGSWLLGELYRATAALLEARRAWERGLAVITRVAPGARHPSVLDLHARLLLSLGRPADARPLLLGLDRIGYRDPVFTAFRREHDRAPESPR